MAAQSVPTTQSPSPTAEFVVVFGVTFAVRKHGWRTVKCNRSGDVVVVHAGGSGVDARVSGLSTLEITARGAGA